MTCLIGVGHAILNLHLGVGHPVLCQMEGVGQVFSIHYIFTSPLFIATNMHVKAHVTVIQYKNNIMQTRTKWIVHWHKIFLPDLWSHAL